MDDDKLGKDGKGVTLSSSLDENEEELKLPLLSSSDTKSCKSAQVCVFFIRLDRLRWGDDDDEEVDIMLPDEGFGEEREEVAECDEEDNDDELPLPLLPTLSANVKSELSTSSNELPSGVVSSIASR